MSFIAIHATGIVATIMLKFFLLLAISMKASTIRRYMKALESAGKRYDIYFLPADGVIYSRLTGETAHFTPILPSVRLFTPKFMVYTCVFGWLNVPFIVKHLVEVVRHPRDLLLWSDAVAQSVINRTEALKSCEAGFARSQFLDVCQSSESEKNIHAVQSLINRHFDRIIAADNFVSDQPKGVC